MIAAISGVNFKGGDFAIELQDHNLIIGPNGSGKSSISEALRLLLMDYVPGIGKVNQDILDSLATNEIGRIDEIAVTAITDDGISLSKKYERNKKGVSQYYYIGQAENPNQHHVDKDEFLQKRADIGSPTIFNISEFWALSDAKKIDALFSIYPVGDPNIDIKINAKRKEINSLNEQHRTAERIIQELNKSKAEAPEHGSLAEVNDELVKLNAELSLMKQHRARLEKAEREAQAKAHKEQTVQDAKEVFPGAEVVDKSGKPVRDTGPSQKAVGAMENEAFTSIKKIIDAIIKVGCKTCINGAGMMIAKDELNKYKGGNREKF